MDILIETKFNPGGLQAATKALQGFANTMKGLNSSIGKFSVVSDKAFNQSSQFVNGFNRELLTMSQNITKAEKKLSQGFNVKDEAQRVRNDLLGIGKGIQETSTKFQALGQTTKIGFSKLATDISALRTNLGSVPATMGTVQSSTTNAFNTASNAVRNNVGKISGYLSGLKKQAISVGDVFGFWIGTMILQACYKATVGMAMLKEDAISTFKFMKYPAEELSSTINYLTETAARMPRVGIPEMIDGMKRMAMTTHLTTKQMRDMAPVFGDTVTLFKQEGRTAEDAAKALADAVTGGANAFKRMQEIGVMNKDQLTSRGWKGTAEDVDGFTRALKQLYSERALTGISLKLDSTADALEYMSEMINFAGMKIGEYLLPIIKQLALALAWLVTVQPDWLLALEFGVLVFAAAVLVLVPLLASLSDSFGILFHTVSPITSRIKGASQAIRILGDDVDYTNSQMKKMNIATPDEMANRPVTPIYRQKKVKQVSPEGVVSYKTVDAPVASARRNIKGLGTDIEITGKGVKKLDKNFNKAGVSTKGMGASFKRAGSITKSLGKGFLSTAGSALTLGLGLSNPLGWILLIIEAIVVLISVMGWWDDIIKLLTPAWDRLVSIFAPLTAKVKENGNAALEAIGKWKGWDVIAGYIQDCVDAYMGFWKWMDKSGTSAAIMKGLGDAFSFLGYWVMYVFNAVDKFYRLLFYGEGTWKGTNDQIYGALVGLTLLMNPITLLMVAWKYLGHFIELCRTEFEKWAKSKDGKLTLIELNNAVNSLKDAWNVLTLAFMSAWTELAPAIDELKTALYGLFVELGIIKPEIGGLGATATQTKDGGVSPLKDAVGLFTWAVQGAIFIIKMMIPVINAVAWILINVVIPGFKLTIWVIRQFIGIAVWLITKWTEVRQFFRRLPGNINAALMSIPGILYGIFKKAYDWVLSKVDWNALGKKVGDIIKGGLFGALGINSPSTVGMDAGKYLGQGIQIGIENWVSKGKGFDQLKEMVKDKMGFNALKDIVSKFNSFEYKFYFDSLQSVNQTLTTLTGNCYDAATAFITMARAGGINAQMYRTFVNGIPHRIVNLPDFGAWFDPSGVMGKGLHKGRAPGSPAGGYVVNNYIQGNTIREEEDIEKIGNETSRKLVEALDLGDI
jgi:hypothetical protein